jgi:hypothetical protein
MGAQPVTAALLALSGILFGGFALTRMSFLAPGRLGFLFYFSNILVDVPVKRPPHFARRSVEVLVLLGGAALCLASLPKRPEALLAVAAFLLALELAEALRSNRIFSAPYAHPDARDRSPYHGGPFPEGLRGAVPDPSYHPDLVVNFAGPFVRRMPRYDLGDLAVGRRVEITVLIGNHSPIPCQAPVGLILEGGGESVLEESLPAQIPPLGPGQVFRGRFVLHAQRPGARGTVRVGVTCGDRTSRFILGWRSVFAPPGAGIQEAEITRYPGACRSAFAWRGDMDHYDEVTFQSIEGLENTLGLAARYRFPQTMYLTPRLTLNLEEAREFHAHFGVDRGQERIPDFIAWMKENVSLKHEMSYPFEAEKPFAMELGNHMYLHYGTDAAAAPANAWRLGAAIGEGRHPWQGDECDSFSEQRDNARAAAEAIERAFGFRPLSWGIPDSTIDASTPAALEAAGCAVASNCDARPPRDIFFQPRPHHPAGTGLVELTKRYPGDPSDAREASMVLFWTHRAHRLGVPVIFMCHQHMRLFAGQGCARATEHILRHVLTRFNGDLHVNTVCGIGTYWGDVLSPERKKIAVSVREGAVHVENSGDRPLSDVPVDLAYPGGRHATVLVDLPARGAVRIGPDGTVVS